ncbi:MAG: Phosphoglycerate kinase [Parcubacteria group bacterium]|nr:Phosphoglycerate kinase [Parcubacteria group bacterium]
MPFKTIEEAGDLSGKRALVRVDWNVPIENGEVRDDFRIKQSQKTISFLKEKGAKVILITHLEPETLSVEPLRKYLPEGVELLENLRQNPGEKENSPEFAKELAEKGDVYVNEAFSASHRKHASIIGVPKLLPSFAGLQFAEEVQQLSKAFAPAHPFLFILGGAKFETKIPLIKNFIDSADSIFVGGALAHNFFKEQGVDIKQSLVSEGEFELSSLIQSGKIMLPADPLWKDEKIKDAGPETIALLETKIKDSKFILWNGPLGNYEEGFKEGTLAVAKLLSECNAEVIVGGADTLAAIKELNLFDSFSFVSTGGGAMLDFLANKTLPGIEALG